MGKNRNNRAYKSQAEIIGDAQPIECPNLKCDGELRLTSRGGKLIYQCTRFPRCKRVQGAHPNGRPTALPADKETSSARVAAHYYFDRLWKPADAPMTRQEAYEWMEIAMDMTNDEAHIGKFDQKTCERLIRKVEEFFELRTLFEGLAA